MENNGEYFVSLNYYLQEVHKVEEQVADLKKLLKYYKEENKNLEKENKEIKERLKTFFNQLGGINE